ncbi:MAG: DUF5924 family protein [Salinisphaeraceae bacterium]
MFLQVHHHQSLLRAARIIWRHAVRYRRLLPVASFAAGLASFFLVERQAQLAQWLTAFLLLGWIWLIGEGLFGRLLSRWLRPQWSEAATRLAAQSLHQETLFFTLPFFLATTTWASGQVLFTGTLMLAAAASIVDPIYLGVIASRRWLFLGFHAFTLFVALLTALPIMLQLTTGESLGLATLAMMIFALPGVAGVLDVRRTRRWLTMGLLTLALGGFAWTTRGWIPPATLRVTDAAITFRVTEPQRIHGEHRPLVDAGRLAEGLYAFTAIRAPRGLHQPVIHEWRHEGQLVDRIEIDIVGGREQGYRAWSHKTEFPPKPYGDWQVVVRTDDGQLIGVLRFRVV